MLLTLLLVLLLLLLVTLLLLELEVDFLLLLWCVAVPLVCEEAAVPVLGRRLRVRP